MERAKPYNDLPSAHAEAVSGAAAGREPGRGGQDVPGTSILEWSNFASGRTALKEAVDLWREACERFAQAQRQAEVA